MALLLLFEKHLCVFWYELGLRLAVSCCRRRWLLSQVLDRTRLSLKWSSCAFSSLHEGVRWDCWFWQLFHWGERWFESCQRRFAAHTGQGRHGWVRLLIELLVQVGDQVLIGLQTLLSLLKLWLKSGVETFKFADLYLKQLRFFHLANRLAHQILDLLLAVCWLLLCLFHCLLLRLVFLSHLLRLLLELLDDLVAFTDFILRSLQLSFKFGVGLFELG